MFNEELRTVTLLCDNSIMGSVVDRFGEKVKTAVADDGHFTAEVEVSVSPTFFGWIIGFGGKMKIAAPEDVQKRFSKTARLVSQTRTNKELKKTFSPNRVKFYPIRFFGIDKRFFL